MFFSGKEARFLCSHAFPSSLEREGVVSLQQAVRGWWQHLTEGKSGVGCSKGQEKEVARGESRGKPGPIGVTGNDFSQLQRFTLSGGIWGSGEKLLRGEKPQKEGLTSWFCQMSLRLRSPLREGGQDGQ